MLDGCANVTHKFGLRRAAQLLDADEFEDSQLVGKTLSGDLKSYELLVRRYQKLVYNVIFQMLRSHETSADMTQETFLRAFRGLDSFNKDWRFKPWLLRIATNTTLNWIRDNKQADSLEAWLEDSPQDEPAAADDVERQVEWCLSQDMLFEALTRLPPRHRHVFVLKYQHDLSYEDIAQIMNEPETTIKSLLYRVREQLKNMLAPVSQGDLDAK
jgi:RNA polymerase sigma-70 factor (ECF subfamily)